MGLQARGLAPAARAGGGEVNASTEVVEEASANVGAMMMGRNMFGGGPGPWGEEPLEWLVGRGPALPRRRSSSSPTTSASRSRWRAGRRSTSSPTGSRPRSSRRGPRPEGKDVAIGGGARGDPAVPRRRPRRRDVAQRRPGPARRRRAAVRRDHGAASRARAGPAWSRPPASPTSSTGWAPRRLGARSSEPSAGS